MLQKARTIPGIKGEVYLYFHSKAPLPGTDIWGPFSGPFFVSKEYAKRCIAKGLNIEVVDPEINQAHIKPACEQPD